MPQVPPPSESSWAMLGCNPVMGSRLVDVSYSDTVARAGAARRQWLRRRLYGRQSRQALSSQRLGKDLPRRQNSAAEAAARGIGEAAACFRARPADRRRQRQDLDRRNQSRSANAALGNLIAERTKNEQLWRQAEAGKDIDLPQLLSDKSIADLRAKRKDLAIEYRAKAANLQAGLPGDGANQESDG